MGSDPGKLLMVFGAIILIVGGLIWLNLFSWFGRLPGDISVKKGDFSFFFPITTCLVVSVVLTLIFRSYRK